MKEVVCVGDTPVGFVTRDEDGFWRAVVQIRPELVLWGQHREAQVFPARKRPAAFQWVQETARRKIATANAARIDFLAWNDTPGRSPVLTTLRLEYPCGEGDLTAWVYWRKKLFFLGEVRWWWLLTRCPGRKLYDVRYKGAPLVFHDFSRTWVHSIDNKVFCYDEAVY
jgi:hypothetical protein